VKAEQAYLLAAQRLALAIRCLLAASRFKNLHLLRGHPTQQPMRQTTQLQIAQQHQLCLVLLTVQNAVGGQGYIVKTRLLTNQKTCTARFRLSFYHTAPSPVNDNAPKPMLYANKDKLIGRIDLDPCNTEDTSSDAAYALSTTLMPYVCAAADTTIYCILTTLDAFTPASAQQFFVEITCELS
jgi:hypothetical protein